MNELTFVDMSMGDQQVPTVDAWQLYSKLGIRTTFKSWIRRGIQELGLAEHVDYLIYRPDSAEYRLAIGAAIKLCAAERTERGELLKKQLLDIWLAASQSEALAKTASVEAVAEAKLAAVEAKLREELAGQARLIEAQARVIESQNALLRDLQEIRTESRPKKTREAEPGERLETFDKLILLLMNGGVELTEKQVCDKLLKRGFLSSSSGVNMPTALSKGLIEAISRPARYSEGTPFKRVDGTVVYETFLMLTLKGLEFFLTYFKLEGSGNLSGMLALTNGKEKENP
jgi:phage anti-repressor protein